MDLLEFFAVLFTGDGIFYIKFDLADIANVVSHDIFQVEFITGIAVFQGTFHVQFGQQKGWGHYFL
jgi:hypothetical protein